MSPTFFGSPINSRLTADKKCITIAVIVLMRLQFEKGYFFHTVKEEIVGSASARGQSALTHPHNFLFSFYADTRLVE